MYLEYVGIAIELGFDWLEPVYLFLKGLNVFNINIGSEVYIATVVTCIVIIMIFSLFIILASKSYYLIINL
jgi:hypothetical protein